MQETELEERLGVSRGEGGVEGESKRESVEDLVDEG